MEILSIINGEIVQVNLSAGFFHFRFGDGYIMIGFSAGYLIVISTYHKEIGEVGKGMFGY